MIRQLLTSVFVYAVHHEPAASGEMDAGKEARDGAGET